MSRRRFDNLDPQRQERLFESAAAEFGEKGYEAASLNRILDKSGMSKSSLYYYFDDKADLFGTMLERGAGYLIKKVGGFDPQALTAETYWSELEDLTRRMVGIMNGQGWYVRLGRALYRLRGTSGEPASVGRFFQIARHWTENLIVRGQTLGVVRTDLPNELLVDSALALAEALDRWSVDHWNDFDEKARVEMAARMVDILRRVLAETPSA